MATTAPQARSIAFFPVRHLHIPHNNREIYLSRELASRGWNVYWLRPRSGTSDGVEPEWPILRFPDLDIRGRKYLLPAYLARRLRNAGIRIVWLSGWNIRDLSELRWMVRILKAAGIRIIYDPIDPICEFEAAQGRVDPDRQRERIALVQKIYADCDLIVCVTPELLELLAEHGAPRDRLIVGRWGTDASRFDPASTRLDLRERLGLGPHTFLVGWLGTMEPFKGLREIVLPLIEATAWMELDIHFVIAGRGTLQPEVRQWARERPHLPVSILPSIPYDDAPNFTGSLDAYLVPTNPDSEYAQAVCPVKCFDALAMGTPLIVTRTRATRFLEDARGPVTLVDFDRDAFLAALLDRYRAPRPSAPTPGVHGREHSHQSVSVILADAIEALSDRLGAPTATVGVGAAGEPHDRRAFAIERR
jgi:glycosyltransferase involved in cell wall biosynthesis